MIGRSNIVGKPMALLLLGDHCTVTIAHSRTRDLPDVVRRADIVVAAVGRPEMVKGDWLKPGAIVIDVGINRIAGEGGNSHLAGDVDFASASEVAGAITPVPGGVGPMTIACLIRNTMVSRRVSARDGFRWTQRYDRAVHHRLHHAGRNHRSAWMCADLRVADRRDGRGASPANGHPLGSGRLVASCIFFALLGEPLLRTLGISLSAFRLAGGIMLFIIALEMVFEKRTERREERAEEIKGTPEAEDISVFPMAIPMIAGPGSIASIMLLTARADGLAEDLIVLGALTAVMILTLAALLAAGPLMKLIGVKLEAMITRILGVILAALAAQFVLDGLERSLPGLAG